MNEIFKVINSLFLIHGFALNMRAKFFQVDIKPKNFTHFPTTEGEC